MRISDWSSDVCSSDLKTIDGLYVVGNSQARMDNGALMQSGITNARGITHGYLAGRHAAGKPSELLAERLRVGGRSEEHTSELPSLMRISYAVFCLKKKHKLSIIIQVHNITTQQQLNKTTK